jgi:homoserine O-acetyltransferase
MGSRDYKPVSLERIQAPCEQSIRNDERNPPETGIMKRELKRVTNGRLFLVPSSNDASSHATVYFAKFWKQQLQDLLETAPRRATQ